MNPQEQTPNPIQPTDASAIPELAFRNFRGEEDYPLIFDIYNRSRQADHLSTSATLSEIVSGFSQRDNFDPRLDLFIAEVDGEAAAYNRGYWSAGDGEMYYELKGWVAAEWRRKGIGAALLGLIEARMREVAHQHAEKIKYFQTWNYNDMPAYQGLMDSAGYQIASVGYDMQRALDEPIPEAPLPEGLEIRPALEGEKRAIWEAKEEAFLDSWGHIVGKEKDYQRWADNPLYDPGLWKVAWDGDQVAGMALNYTDPDSGKRGYTDPVCVRRPWRQQGLARALLVESVKMFKGMGYEKTALSVSANSPHNALRLYQSVGYQEVGGYVVYRKPLEEGSAG